MTTLPDIPSHHVVEFRNAECATHGTFEQKKWALSKPSLAPFCKPFWSKCPACEQTIQHEQDDAEAKSRGTTNAGVRMQRMLQDAGVPPRFCSASLGNYNTALPKQKIAHKWASDYAYKFDLALSSGRSCALVGNQGTGKTHLAVAIMKVLLLKGATARYVSCMDLLARFKATYAAKAAESEASVFADYTRCDLLVVDEIGRHQDTSYDQASLFRVFDNRYQGMKPTLMLSNLPIKDFETMMSAALIDRLREGGGGHVSFDFASQRGVEHERERNNS